jgi:hypothetical protein
MVRFESAWHCPACGSTILDAPAMPQPQRRDKPHETSAHARRA